MGEIKYKEKKEEGLELVENDFIRRKESPRTLYV